MSLIPDGRRRSHRSRRGRRGPPSSAPAIKDLDMPATGPTTVSLTKKSLQADSEFHRLKKDQASGSISLSSDPPSGAQITKLQKLCEARNLSLDALKADLIAQEWTSSKSDFVEPCPPFEGNDTTMTNLDALQDLSFSEKLPSEDTDTTMTNLNELQDLSFSEKLPSEDTDTNMTNLNQTLVLPEEKLDVHRGMKWIFKGPQLVIEKDSLKSIFVAGPGWTNEPQLSQFSEFFTKRMASKELSMNLLGPKWQNWDRKVYLIRHKIGDDTQENIVSFLLPLDPENKTKSEVATLHWMHYNTPLPVPKVIDHLAYRDRDQCNSEYVTTNKLPGEPLADMWLSMSWSAKLQLVAEFASYTCSLFRHQLQSIGNLYPHALKEVGRIVSKEFFWNDHMNLKDISRGPFHSSQDWLAARLALLEHDCNVALASNQDYLAKTNVDSNQTQHAKIFIRKKNIVEKLKALLPIVFPDPECMSIPEASMIFNENLSLNNILVDDSGKLTGVLGWGCVSALPLWKACDYPLFLKGPDQLIMPSIHDHEEDDYFQKSFDHERTLLRQFFLFEMQRLEPGWVEVFMSNHLKKDFELAVRSCDVFMYNVDVAAIADVEAFVSFAQG